MSSSKKPPLPPPPAAPDPSLQPSLPSLSPQHPVFALGSELPPRSGLQKGKKNKAPKHVLLKAKINPKALYKQGFLPGVPPSYSPNNRPKKQASKAPGTAAMDGHSAPFPMVADAAAPMTSVRRTDDFINPNPTAPSALLPLVPTPTATSASTSTATSASVLPSASTRARLWRHTSQNSCSVCHRQYRRHR
jgi:hypothetical protein